MYIYNTMINAKYNIYEGEWDDNMPNGKGRKILLNGKIHEGDWKDGNIIKEYTIEKTYYNNDKPTEIKSARIKNQKYNDCWAHASSRNFVRTLQILDIIKTEYIEQFYDLFYTILTSYKNCDDGGTYYDFFYLYNYIKDNYTENIFMIKYNDNDCIKGYCSKDKLNTTILNLTSDDKKKFICDLEYLFNNNLLFIGKYIYYIDLNSENNKPSKAIKTMLYFRLQPYVIIYLNKYTINYSSISELNNSDFKCNDNLECISSDAHSVNLRK